MLLFEVEFSQDVVRVVLVARGVLGFAVLVVVSEFRDGVFEFDGELGCVMCDGLPLRFGWWSDSASVYFDVSEC